MSLLKTKLPKLLSSKEIRAKGLLDKHATNDEEPTDAIEEITTTPQMPPAPEGLLCYFTNTDTHGLLADGIFQMMQQFFKLLDTLQTPNKDGLSGLPLRIYPQFEVKDGLMGFRLTGTEELLQKATQLLLKINTHLGLLRTGKASLQNISQRTAALYIDFLKSLCCFRQQLSIYPSEDDSAPLLTLDHEEVAQLIKALEAIKQAKKPLSLQGKITGFSLNNKTVDFLVLSPTWNGVKTAKAVDIPISCQGDIGLVDFAKTHFDKPVEIETFVQYDNLGKPHYELISITTTHNVEKITQRIVHNGPRGGQFYLSYKGKRIYLNQKAG